MVCSRSLQPCILHSTVNLHSARNPRLGSVLTLYGRAIVLVDADEFTRGYYRHELGQDIPPAIPYPQNPITVRRDALKRKTKSKRSFWVGALHWILEN